MKRTPAVLGILFFFLASASVGEGVLKQIEAEPKETYYAFHTALRRLDMEGIRARWLPDKATAEDEEAMTRAILEMRQIIPPEIEVLNEHTQGQDAFLKVMGYYPNGGKSEGTVYLVRTVDRWRVRDQEWGFITLPPPPPTVKGEGVIEGVVTLPPVEANGDLYVFAVLENESFPAAYQRIAKEQLVWAKIPYRIPDLPAGRYWVYAYWDTAPPSMNPEENLFAVFTGDFAGEFLATVTLQRGEVRGPIDFALSRTLKAKDEENYGTDYTLVDVGVAPGEEGKPALLLSVRSTGEKPVRNVSLICRINGKELLYHASSPGPLILPQKVREFDITTCYESYLFFLERLWQEENLSREELKIEIVSKDNDARLEKEVVVR